MNKKLIVVGIIVVVVIGGLIALSQANIGIANAFLDGEKEEAVMGDLIIPVSATGTVEPAKIIQIKSKASGEVTNIHVVEGQMVKAGDVMVELDPVDEKRNVEARQADVDRSKSALEKTKIAVDNLEKDLPLQTALAQARLEDAKARYENAEYEWDRVKGFVEKGIAMDKEIVVTKTAFLTAKASLEVAATDLERAKNNETILLRDAEESVKQAEAAYRVAQKALDEAELRLEETTVRARSAGMVYSIRVREGEMIQSGTASLTGGTTLMVLADTSAMFVVAQIDEADIGAIRKIAPSYARPGTTEKLNDDDYETRAEAIIEDDLASSSQPTKSPEKVAETGDSPDALPDVVKGLESRPVDVTVEAYRTHEYKGVIERILPEPQRVNNAIAFPVRIRLVGTDLEKLMGLQADLSFTTEKRVGVVKVKNEALHSEGRQCFVYKPVAGAQRDEEKVPVEIGMTDGTFTEIVSGVDAGDLVFTRRPVKTEREKEEG